MLSLFDGPPTPEAMLALSEEDLRGIGFSRRKVEYAHDLARHALDGSLEPNRFPKLSDEEVVAEICAVRGFGTWTAEVFLIMHLGRPDVVVSGDLGIRAGDHDRGRAGEDADAESGDRAGRALASQPQPRLPLPLGVPACGSGLAIGGKSAPRANASAPITEDRAMRLRFWIGIFAAVVVGGGAVVGSILTYKHDEHGFHTRQQEEAVRAARQAQSVARSRSASSPRPGAFIKADGDVSKHEFAIVGQSLVSENILHAAAFIDVVHRDERAPTNANRASRSSNSGPTANGQSQGARPSTTR